MTAAISSLRKKETGASKAQRRRALQFAAEISAIAMTGPDAEIIRDLNQIVARIRAKYGFSADEKRSLTLNAIRLGFQTPSDIAEFTKIRLNDVYSIVGELEASEIVVKHRAGLHGSGRKVDLIYLAKD